MYYTLVFRPAGKSCTCLVNTSGKIVLTGANSIQDAMGALDDLVWRMRSLGFNAKPGPIEVRNLVMTGRLADPVSLSYLSSSPMFAVEYDSGRFPSAVLRHRSGHGVVMLFGSGSFNIMGASSEGQAAGIRDDLLRFLSKTPHALP